MNSNRMKAVLLSIKPKWCELIASGKKTVEVRKTMPKIDVPFKVYIYCTKGENLWKNKNLPFIAYNRIIDDLPEHLLNGKVIGEFVCDKIDTVVCVDTLYMQYIKVNDKMDMFFRDISFLDVDKLGAYIGFNKEGYGWHISNLIIYDKPKELSEFRKYIDCHRGKDREKCICCWDCEIKRPPQDWRYIDNVGL